MRARYAIEEEQPLQVVELMLQGACLERIRFDDALLAAARHEATDDDAGRSGHVSGQVWDRQAPFPSYLSSFRELQNRRAQHYQTRARRDAARASDVEDEQ